jgi:hypothetical protein
VTSTTMFSAVVILSDSDDEEEEVHEENAEIAPSSTVKSPAPTASAADIDEAPKRVQYDNSDDCTLDQEIGDSSSGGDEAGLP